MSKYQTYPKYKDTDIAELGSVPIHWQVAALRRYIEEHRQGYYTTAPYVDDGVKLLRITDLRPNGEMDVTDCPKVPNNDQSLVNYDLKAGDVVFARTGGAGSFGVVPNLSERVVYASYLIRFRFYKEKLHSGFLKFVLQGDAFQKSVRKNIHGGVNQNIHAEDIKDTFITKPNIDEQTQIAAFLDHETAKIDTLIEKQQQLIELLKEKRQAVISHAVTKGLNPDVPMKDSGVEWLGEVPEHWVVTKTSYCSTSLDAFRIPIEANIRGNRQGQYPYYGASGVIDFVDDYLFDDDLILVCEDGWNLMLRTQPVARFVTGKIWVNNHAHILKPIDIDATLLAECIELTPLNLFISGMRQPKLTADSLKNIPVAYSIDKEEQDELVNFISKYKKQILQLTNKAQHSIELLQERRTALISAAVTGKIDVRNWIAPTISSDANEAQQEVTA